jgi:heat shock protein HslJ
MLSARYMRVIILVLAVLFVAGCASVKTGGQALDISGAWHIEVIGDLKVSENSTASIQFEKDGKLGGNASCNRYFGQYALDGNQLKIDERMGATKMMCGEQVLMQQEDKLFSILPRAATVVIENDLLIIRDNDGQIVLQASRAE